MKFLRRSALWFFLGLTVFCTLGVVYIDNIKHFFITQDGYVRMFVNTNYVFGVDTNAGFIGFGNSTNTDAYFRMVGKPVTNTTSGNGVNGATIAGIFITSGVGGSSTDPSSASGGGGGNFQFAAGAGGTASATTNSTGGNGGVMSLAGGAGASPGLVATNSGTGGNGGAVQITGGAGASGGGAAPTNTVGGDGGAISITAGGGGTLSSGWSRKGGAGGALSLTAGTGRNSTRTNGAAGGAVAITAGNAGSATTSGDAGTAGSVSITAGNGNSGVGTNSNGGAVAIAGGASGGSGAIAGPVALGITAAGVQRGFVGAGTLQPSEWMESVGNVMTRSNIVYTNVIQSLATNGSANTNYVWDFNQGMAWAQLTNNLSLTNFVNVQTNKAGNTVRVFEAELVNRTVVYPAFATPQFGILIYTNDNSQPWQTFTAGVRYAVSITWFGTNGLLSITKW